MNSNASTTKNKSLGKLRVATKTKPRSPIMIGTLRLQRHTAAEILKQFEESDGDEAVCNLAAWVNRDDQGQYLTIEVSPKYVSHQSHAANDNRLDFIFGGREDDN